MSLGLHSPRPPFEEPAEAEAGTEAAGAESGSTLSISGRGELSLDALELDDRQGHRVLSVDSLRGRVDLGALREGAPRGRGERGALERSRGRGLAGGESEVCSHAMRRIYSLILLLLLLAPVAHVGAQEAVDGGVDAGVNAAVDAGVAVHRTDLSSPRETVRSFVLSMQRAENDRPELIDEAARCLDTAWIGEADEARSRSRQLASQLFELFALLNVVVDEIPTEVRRGGLSLWEPADEAGAEEGLSISLERVEGDWLFSEATLRALPAIRDAIERENTDEPAREDEDVTSAFRSPRATMRTFLEAMNSDPPDIERAADCLEPPEGVRPAWPVIRREQAYRLHSALLRLRTPVLTEIPDEGVGDAYTWHVHGRGRIVLVRIDEDDEEAEVGRGEWRFSRSTLNSIERVYESLGQGPLPEEVRELGYSDHLSIGLRIERFMPESLRDEVLGLSIWQWFGLLCSVLLAGFAFALGTLVGRGISSLLCRALELEASSSKGASRLPRAFGRLGAFYALYRVVISNPLLLPEPLANVAYPLGRALLLIAVSLICLRFVQVTDSHLQKAAGQGRARAASLLIPLLESFFRLMVGLAVAALLLRLLGLSKTTVIGGLGLLGAAIGLAAHSSIANLIAALSIVYDRPFRVGDWVNLDGVDATVERLGLVSVRLRTFYNSLIVVPNQQFVVKTVDNYGERRYRRLRHFLRLRYDTPAAKIDALCEGLRELVRLHPYTRKDYFHIYLNELTPSSADVMIYIFFEVPDWATELRERHRYLIDALALVEELGIEWAYPTQRLLMEGEAESTLGMKTGEATLSSARGDGVRRAQDLFARTYGAPPVERGPVIIQDGPLIAGFDDDGDAEGGDGD